MQLDADANTVRLRLLHKCQFPCVDGGDADKVADASPKPSSPVSLARFKIILIMPLITHNLTNKIQNICITCIAGVNVVALLSPSVSVFSSCIARL